MDAPEPAHIKEQSFLTFFVSVCMSLYVCLSVSVRLHPQGVTNSRDPVYFTTIVVLQREVNRREERSYRSHLQLKREPSSHPTRPMVRFVLSSIIQSQLIIHSFRI